MPRPQSPWEALFGGISQGLQFGADNLIPYRQNQQEQQYRAGQDNIRNMERQAQYWQDQQGQDARTALEKDKLAHKQHMDFISATQAARNFAAQQNQPKNEKYWFNQWLADPKNREKYFNNKAGGSKGGSNSPTAPNFVGKVRDAKASAVKQAQADQKYNNEYTDNPRPVADTTLLNAFNQAGPSYMDYKLGPGASDSVFNELGLNQAPTDIPIGRNDILNGANNFGNFFGNGGTIGTRERVNGEWLDPGAVGQIRVLITDWDKLPDDKKLAVYHKWMSENGK